MRNIITAISNRDGKAMLAAALCFVHCVAGPILLSLSGFSSLIGVSEKIEPIFLFSSFLLSVVSLVPGYRRRHGRLSCLALFIGGLLCLLLRSRLQSGMLTVPVVTGVGAALIVGSHALNLRYSKRCPCCEPVAGSELAGGAPQRQE
ncbi:MAG TPA: MerC domain-containing protein [Candidatus Solibacter sp.]